MQIHEITLKNKQTLDEAGILSGITNVASRAAGQYVQSKTGVDPNAQVGAGQRQRAATQATDAILKPMAQQLQREFAAMVQQEMKTARPPAVSFNELQQADRQRITAELGGMVQKMIGNVDYHTLPTRAQNSPEDQKEAQLVVQAINNGIQAVIASVAKAVSPSEAFYNLVRDGIQPAKSIIQFSPGQGAQANQMKFIQSKLEKGQNLNSDEKALLVQRAADMVKKGGTL